MATLQEREIHQRQSSARRMIASRGKSARVGKDTPASSAPQQLL